MGEVVEPGHDLGEPFCTSAVAGSRKHSSGRNLKRLSFGPQTGNHIIGGDIASDLYGPQFWDDNFQFSFSVVVSCKSNKQLGYF